MTRHGPEDIAAAIAKEMGREVDYRPVEAGDGAARAAAMLLLGSCCRVFACRLISVSLPLLARC